jgi:hypothetical protein
MNTFFENIALQKGFILNKYIHTNIYFSWKSIWGTKVLKLLFKRWLRDDCSWCLVQFLNYSLLPYQGVLAVHPNSSGT